MTNPTTPQPLTVTHAPTLSEHVYFDQFGEIAPLPLSVFDPKPAQCGHCGRPDMQVGDWIVDHVDLDEYTSRSFPCCLKCAGLADHWAEYAPDTECALCGRPCSDAEWVDHDIPGDNHWTYPQWFPVCLKCAGMADEWPDFRPESDGPVDERLRSMVDRVGDALAVAGAKRPVGPLPARPGRMDDAVHRVVDAIGSALVGSHHPLRRAADRVYTIGLAWQGWGRRRPCRGWTMTGRTCECCPF
jgi:5-methylcytosine-specific restriction endonuclease McrA